MPFLIGTQFLQWENRDTCESLKSPHTDYPVAFKTKWFLPGGTDIDKKSCELKLGSNTNYISSLFCSTFE